MNKRSQIALAGSVGLVWSIVVLWIGKQLVVPIAMIQPALMGALFAPGLVLALIIARLAQRRFFDDSLIDGQRFAQDSAAEKDQRVLSNTIEQIVLALCIWPFAGFSLGAGVVLALGVSFAVARLLFWVGYHHSAVLRGVGFAATFFPTVLAALWVIWRFLVG